MGKRDDGLYEETAVGDELLLDGWMDGFSLQLTLRGADREGWAFVFCGGICWTRPSLATSF